jgi:uncharacterized protein (TIGR00369 family)
MGLLCDSGYNRTQEALMHNTDMITRFTEFGIPFNVFLGMQVDEADNGVAVMRIPARPELTGDPFRPAVHGGVISALADTVGGLAVFTRAEEDQAASTVDLRVDYLRPGNVDQDVIAKSTVIRMGNRVAATRTVVYQDDPESPIAMASAVYNVVLIKGKYAQLSESEDGETAAEEEAPSES